MSHEVPYIGAIMEAISLEMARDESVLYYGQDVAPSDDHDLVKAFGRDRIRVSPISETAEIGMAVGAALAGMRPGRRAADGRIHARRDEPGRQRGAAPALHERRAVKVPLVLKAGYGFTAGWSGQHTGTIYGMFTGIPGLKVAVPSTAADAKGLMATAIRDDNPVCYFHHYLLTLEHGEVPDGEYLVPFGQADIRREGGDVTIVAIGWGSAARCALPRRWPRRASRRR